MGGAVFSGGDLGFSGMDTSAAAVAAAAGGGGSAEGVAGPSTAPVEAEGEMAQRPRASAEDGPAESGDTSGDGGEAAMAAESGGGGGEAAAAAESGTLTEEELGLLLQDENVQRAMAEISADPEAVVRYQDDPIVMGVIHSLNAQAGQA